MNAKVSPAISAGERVYWIATSGRATFRMPSARFDAAAEVHRRRKFAPRRVVENPGSMESIASMEFSGVTEVDGAADAVRATAGIGPLTWDFLAATGIVSIAVSSPIER
ncbi:hypothetical protein GCM10009838_81600 [Catenulispora subtropica]|uniref:Uncharacterized protein n=1 Tax=Catenulispora subtropica TaxID=450798 RepID=A0ABN2TAD4_9ACTN